MEVIALLGGGMVQNDDGSWRTTTFDDPGDKFGVAGDRLRVEAAAGLYHANPDVEVFTIGGSGQLRHLVDAPIGSQVMKKELEALNVPPEKIFTEMESGNTYQNLKALKKLAQDKQVGKMTIVSNLWHVPRIRAMIEFAPELKEYFVDSIDCEFLFAEDVVMEYDAEKWEEIIEKAYSSEAMEKRMAIEEKGVEQIKNGTYKFE